MWSSKTQPTPANIRKRIGSAQEAINGAMDLLKQRPGFGKAEQKMLVELNNSHAWLVSVQRKLTR